VSNAVLRVGFLGRDAAAAAVRAQELDAQDAVSVVDAPAPDVRPTCHLVVGVGTATGASRAFADVWLDGVDAVDALWRDRIRPFATNLANGQRAPRARRAVLCAPDPDWAVQARRLIARLDAATRDRTLRIDHIGSTSVPELPAKNLIDLQVVVGDLDVAAEVADAARVAGFVRVRGPLSCADRYGTEHPEAVVVDADPGRSVNVNIRPVTAPIWRETLLFRDWLRASSAARADYLAVKTQLAARPGRDVDDYGTDKIPWISAAAERAEVWATAVDWTP
jgi:dephospho-CoA kinase